MSTKGSSLFDSDDEGGEDIFKPIESPRKEHKKVATEENDPFLNILDNESNNLSPYLTPSTQSPETVEISDDFGSQNIANSSEDLEKDLVSEQARSSTFNKLNNELYGQLEIVEIELEQIKSNYADSQEKLSSKLNEEEQWNSQNEALKAELRISQEQIQTLIIKNRELGLKSEMESETVANKDLVLDNELEIALADKEETNMKLQKLEDDISALRKEKTDQDSYISDLESELAEKDSILSRLKKVLEDKNSEEMTSKISQLEKTISTKDRKISELKDMELIAQQQEREMKLQDQKIVRLEKKIDFLQQQEQRLKNKSPIEDNGIDQPKTKIIIVTEPEKEIIEPVKQTKEVFESVSQTKEIFEQPKKHGSPSKKSAPVPIETPKVSTTINSGLPPHDTTVKTAIIIDKQTGKSLRTATLEERIKKFRGSAENIASDETSATRHTFRRVSSSGSTRSTPSPDLINPRASSQPVSPEHPEEVKIDPIQSLPPSAMSNPSIAVAPYKRTYSPLPARSKIDVDPDTCIACGRRAYPIEKITVDKMPYHKFCFKCIICKSILRPGRHASYEGTIYCLNHFKQEFLGGGGKYPGQIR